MSNPQAKATILGRFDVRAFDDDEPDMEFTLGLVLEFRTAEELRAALKAGIVEFGFPDYPSEQPAAPVVTPEESAWCEQELYPNHEVYGHETGE